MSRLVKNAVEEKMKREDHILPVDRLNESQVRHRKLLVKCLLLKKRNLKEQKLQAKKFLINTKEGKQRNDVWIR